MCEGITYICRDKKITSYFANQQAILPILKKDGKVNYIKWGRRINETGQLPLGGWANLEGIEAGRWDGYFPRAVKITAHSFVEKTIEGKSQWFTLVKDHYIQGLLAHYKDEQRLYVVTLKLENTDAVYPRWPRVILASK